MPRFLILFIVIALSAFNGTKAITAYPIPVKIVADKDSFFLTIRGDENCKFALTNDGYTALSDPSGWYYAYTNTEGEVVKSKYKVSSERMKNNALHSFLKTQKKGIVPNYISEKYNVSSTITRTSVKTLTGKSKNSVVGERRILIILMQFSDLKFKKEQSDFDKLFNEPHYQEDGAYGSVYDYYNKVSYGQLQLKCDVLGPYTTSRDMAYYGENSRRSGGGDVNPKALFDEAIRYAIKDVDLKKYDSDEDGYVDNIHIIFAGYGEEAGASSNAIWSHEMKFVPENFNGMMVDCYSCSPELRGNAGAGISRIGVPCHEIGHALGAMDYYDVDYQTGGYYEGTGEWDIMASGSWNDGGARPADFNPYVKAYNFGWVDVLTLNEDTVNCILPSSSINKIYRIDTPDFGDYFLLENRQSDGIHSAEPGKGLLIYHIGPQIEHRESINSINTTYPQQCYVVCASAKEARPHASTQSYGNISSAGCPFPGNTNNLSFTDTSIPGAFCISGKPAGISLLNILQKTNGNVEFLFGSSGDDTSPDQPIDDDETGGEIIWSDDFEIINHNFTQNWISEGINGFGRWYNKSYSSVASEKEPPLLSGNRYMAMESYDTGTVMGEDIRYGCCLTSKDIRLEAGEYYLTGKYGGYTTRKISKDTLYVEIRSAITGDCIKSKSYHIKKRGEWDSFVVPINVSENGSVFIAFEGYADQKSILFLDNLKFCRIRTESCTQSIIDSSEEGFIFNLNGVYLGSHEILDTLSSGLYLIKSKNGIRKIMVH